VDRPSDQCVLDSAVPCVLDIQAGIGFKPTGEIHTREGGRVDVEKVKIAPAMARRRILRIMMRISIRRLFMR
jgi:hypothetical protein